MKIDNVIFVDKWRTMSSTLQSIKFYKQYPGEAKFERALDKETKRYNSLREQALRVA